MLVVSTRTAVELQIAFLLAQLQHQHGEQEKAQGSSGERHEFSSVNGVVLVCRPAEGRDKTNIITSFMMLSALLMMIGLGSARIPFVLASTESEDASRRTSGLDHHSRRERRTTRT